MNVCGKAMSKRHYGGANMIKRKRKKGQSSLQSHQRPKQKGCCDLDIIHTHNPYNHFYSHSIQLVLVVAGGAEKCHFKMRVIFFFIFLKGGMGDSGKGKMTKEVSKIEKWTCYRRLVFCNLFGIYSENILRRSTFTGYCIITRLMVTVQIFHAFLLWNLLQ